MVTTERLQLSVLIGAIRCDYVAVTIKSPPEKDHLDNKRTSYFNSGTTAKSCFTQMLLLEITANMLGKHMDDEEEVLG